VVVGGIADATESEWSGDGYVGGQINERVRVVVESVDLNEGDARVVKVVSGRNIQMRGRRK